VHEITRSPNVAQVTSILSILYLIHPLSYPSSILSILRTRQERGVIPNRQFLKNNIRPNCGARLGNADRDCQGKNKISAEMLLYVYDERFTQRNLHQKAMIAFLDGVSGVSMA
jgi:hypothetical protein